MKDCFNVFSFVVYKGVCVSALVVDKLVPVPVSLLPVTL